MAKRDRDMVEEAREEEKEAETSGDRDKEEPAGERKRGGAMRARGGAFDGAKEHKHSLPEKKPPSHHHSMRKRGGKVHGKEPMARLDKRARGGATSDLHPETAAGKMSMPDYEGKDMVPNGGGRGPDKSPYGGGGSHRRPG